LSNGGARLIGPGVDLGGVEAQEVAPLDIRDAAFGDETADVSLVDAEASGGAGRSLACWVSVTATVMLPWSVTVLHPTDGRPRPVRTARPRAQVGTPRTPEQRSTASRAWRRRQDEVVTTRGYFDEPWANATVEVEVEVEFVGECVAAAADEGPRRCSYDLQFNEPRHLHRPRGARW